MLSKFEVVFSQPDGLQLQEVGDFGDENCLPPLNLVRNTKLHLTIKPPISFSCYYLLIFFNIVSNDDVLFRPLLYRHFFNSLCNSSVSNASFSSMSK
jgi:hypothetical protein